MASDNALAFWISLSNGDSAPLFKSQDIVPEVNEWGQVASRSLGSQIVESDRSELFGVGIDRESVPTGDIVGEVMMREYVESTVRSENAASAGP